MSGKQFKLGIIYIEQMKGQQPDNREKNSPNQ